MGVYIPGMRMPKDCCGCPFNVFKICLINTLQEGKYTVTHSCPLIPVPKHGRLIDADAPMRFEVKIDGAMNRCSVDIYAPTIIEAEDHIGDVNEMVGDSE